MLIIKNIFRVSLWHEIERKHACFTWQVKWKKFGDALAGKKVALLWLVNSNMVKPEKFDHLHLVYHFIVLLTLTKRTCNIIKTVHILIRILTVTTRKSILNMFSKIFYHACWKEKLVSKHWLCSLNYDISAIKMTIITAYMYMLRQEAVIERIMFYLLKQETRNN